MYPAGLTLCWNTKDCLAGLTLYCNTNITSWVLHCAVTQKITPRVSHCAATQKLPHGLPQLPHLTLFVSTCMLLVLRHSSRITYV
jgi:hypothetical protein